MGPMGQLTSSLHILRRKRICKDSDFCQKPTNEKAEQQPIGDLFHPARAAPPLQGGLTGDQYFSISPRLSSATRDKFLEQDLEICIEQLFFGISMLSQYISLKLYCITVLLQQ